MEFYKEFDKAFVEFAESLGKLEKLEVSELAGSEYREAQETFRECRSVLVGLLYEMAREYNDQIEK